MAMINASLSMTSIRPSWPIRSRLTKGIKKEAEGQVKVIITQVGQDLEVSKMEVALTPVKTLTIVETVGKLLRPTHSLIF